MISDREFRFEPDYAIHPGVTIEETLATLGITQHKLAKRMGRPKQAVCDIINGKKAITPETALQLERVLGVPASFWNIREAQYRDALARQQEKEHLVSQQVWASKFPIAEMVRRKWLSCSEDAVARIRALLNFFGVASPDDYEKYWENYRVAFRCADATRNREAITVWLRAGEIAARGIASNDYDESRFQEALRVCRSLTKTNPAVFAPSVQKSCAEAGVAVVFIPELKGVPISGATRWLTPRKALVQLSLRYKTTDSLWFSFFHEAGHILRHPKKAIFLDETNPPDTPEEREANNFAANFLIASDEYQAFRETGVFNKASIVSFANRIGVAPGIVLGRLQHERLVSWKSYSSLKIRLCWANQELNAYSIAT